MKSIPLILRMSRVLVALSLIAGPTGPVYAGLTGAPLSSNYKEEAASRPGGEKNTVQPAGQLKLPMYFEANRGQTDDSVKFFSRASGYNLYLTASESVMVMPPADPKRQQPGVVRMKLKGANANPLIQGLNVLPGRTSYFYGSDPSKWQTGVKQYNKVKFGQVYPGIDMVYRFDKGNVEYDFVVAPGAKPWRILMGFEGAKSLRLDPRGNLVLRLADGEMTYKKPELYQMLGAKKVSVKGRFVLAANSHVRFEVGNYIESKELVIDPAIMYGTYLGGNVDDSITSIAVDGLRQAYVTGWTKSGMSTSGGVMGFPPATKTYPATALDNTNSPVNPAGAKNDVFVAKLSEDGASLIWLAWLGGSLDDQANSIALDSSSAGEPKVFITGTTKSNSAGTAFPAAGPAMQTCNINPAPGSLAFVAELAQPSNIPALVYSTCWGDSVDALATVGNAIAVDALGAAYVTGTTFSAPDATALNMPIVGAFHFPIIGPVPSVAPYGTNGAASEVGFVMKINPAGASVAYSMLLGPQAGITRSNAIAVDTLGQVWVAGMTDALTFSPAGFDATLHHFASTKTGGAPDIDAFVAQVTASGTGLLYATYINGNVAETATAIKLNNGGVTPYNVFVAGYTNSSTDFPSTAYKLFYAGGIRTAVHSKELFGGWDAFILRLNPNQLPAPGVADTPLEMIYATYVGGVGFDQAYSMALDSRDDAYISGWTKSANMAPAGNDTLTDCISPCVSVNVTGAVQTNTSTDETAFVAAIGPTGLDRPFYTFLGGSPGTATKQAANSIVIDYLHNIYVGGITPSNTFPLVNGSLMGGTAGVFTTQINGTGVQATGTDGFVVKIAPVSIFGAPLIACTITSINPGSGLSDGGASVTINGTGFVADYGAGAVTFDGVNAASYSVNTTSTVITAVSPRHPLAGALTAGPAVPLLVWNTVGSCSANYNYTLTATVVADSVCGDDYFFPSPATGAVGTFAYCMNKAGTAKIRVYNTIGDLVAKVEDARAAGAQRSFLNTERLAPGVYLYRLEKNYGGSDSFTSKVKKFVVQH